MEQQARLFAFPAACNISGRQVQRTPPAIPSEAAATIPQARRHALVRHGAQTRSRRRPAPHRLRDNGHHEREFHRSLVAFPARFFDYFWATLDVSYFSLVEIEAFMIDSLAFVFFDDTRLPCAR